MNVTTQLAWQMGYRRQVVELAALRAGALRQIGVAACLADGQGIRALRRGCYTLGDLVLLQGCVTFDVGPDRRRRLLELESEVLPMTQQDRIAAASMFGGAAARS